MYPLMMLFVLCTLAAIVLFYIFGWINSIDISTKEDDDTDYDTNGSDGRIKGSARKIVNLFNGDPKK